MYFSTAILTSVLAASTLVSAAPMHRRQTTMMPGSTRLDSAGALYFISNEGDLNRVIAAKINADGTVNLDRAVSTGGSGAHGITDPDGPDPLFSQGAIKASANGQVLATVNAGSNTVTLFSIDPSSPTNIQRIGNPISSEGEFPVSLAFNGAGDRLCVLNGGTVNGVVCFDVNKQAGLKPIPNTLRSLSLNQTNPATGPAGTASHILFSEDGKQLIASVKGVPPTPGFLAVWDVQDDGSLSQDFKSIAPPSGGALPFGMALIPGKNAVLATDPAVGFEIIDLAGNKSSAFQVDGQVAVCWAALSSKTGNFYLTDIGTSLVTEVSVDDDLNATIVKQYPQGDGAATIDDDIVTIGDKDFLYVLSAGATSIDVLSLDAPGDAKAVERLDIAGPPRAAGVSINAFNLQGMTHFVTQ
ncbi:hypothetical protein C8Q76DRAFT_697176 [Earliella scabrosa]|nr:hypothetical protein C8Q76DRAFT_697176 [Earliella scabrosa]